MKKSIFLYAIIVALTGSCATQTTKEYVDKRDAATLVDSKDYTDVKVAELARDLPTKDTLKPLVEDIIKTNIYPWAREETKPTYSPEEIGALPDTTVIPTKVSDIDNDLDFIQKSVFDTAVGGKLSMTNNSGSAYLIWTEPNTLVGFGSFAFGYNCRANQYYSFATGRQTYADGENSHAEGGNTIAAGNRSHSEGYNTLAEGVNSHAEGNSTKAYGRGSHSEGRETITSNDYSHAEGYGSVASGYYSHAEGLRTVASGLDAHAEGAGTVASGMYSHSDGVNNIASGNGSHSSGIDSHASNNYSYAWSAVESLVLYGSHGDGTFNINPYKGIEGFYVGEKNLKTIITEVAPGGGGGGGVSEARVGEIATNVVREAFKRFDGKVFDFNSMSGVYEALSNVVYSLGGTITNFPPIRR